MTRPTSIPQHIWLIFNTIMWHLQEWHRLNASTRWRGTRRSIRPWGGGCDLLNRRRQGYPHSLEHLPTRALYLAPQQELLPVLLHLHPLQPLQVTDHIRPLELVTPLLQTGLEFLT